MGKENLHLASIIVTPLAISEIPPRNIYDVGSGVARGQTVPGGIIFAGAERCCQTEIIF
jgi:hypothetical protein